MLPRIEAVTAARMKLPRERLAEDVAFASPTCLWSAAVLQHVSLAAMLRADALFLRGKWRLLKALRIDEPIEDVAITTRLSQSIFRALPRRPQIFLAVTFDRERVQLGMARLRLQELVGAFDALPI